MLSKLRADNETYLKNLASQAKLLKEQNRQLLNLKEENLKLNKQINKYRVIKRAFKEKRDFYALKRSTKNLFKNKINDVFKNLNDELSCYGVRIPKVNLSPLDDDSDEKFEIIESIPDTANQMDSLECLYIKDKHFFTEEDYKTIRKDYKAPICSLHELLKTKDELNKQFLFHKTNNNKCFFVDIVKSIKNQVNDYLHTLESSEIDLIDKLKIKICVDGTKIGRKLYLLNFAFTIINDEANCSSCYSHYTLAIGEIKESYDDLKEPMDYLIRQLRQLNIITYENKNITTEFYFAADLKLALIITGLKAANSDYPCLYCHCKKNSLHLIQHCDLRSNSESLKNMNEKGYKLPSLLGDLIPFHRVIICTLHLRLRVFEVLLKQLIKGLAALDEYDGMGYINEKHPNLSKWLSFLNNKCKIKVTPIYNYNKNNAGGVTRDFSGGEILKILSEIDIDERFPDLRDKNDIQQLWKDLYFIDRMVSKNSLSYDECKRNVDDWSKKILKIYTTNHSQTPYIHMFINHLPDLIAAHNSINDFN
jgi:hypothetical protein